jgi:hypothetical protein
MCDVADWIYLAQDMSSDEFYECGNELLGSIKGGGEFLA